MSAQQEKQKKPDPVQQELSNLRRLLDGLKAINLEQAALRNARK